MELAKVNSSLSLSSVLSVSLNYNLNQTCVMDIVILSTLYHHDLPMCMLPKDHLYTVSNIESVLFSSWPMLSIVFIYDSEKSHFPSCRQHVNHSHIFVIWSHITLLNLTTASFVQRKYPLCFIFYVYLFFAEQVVSVK